MSLTLFIVPQLFVLHFLPAPVWDKRVRFLIYAAVLPILWFIFVPKELNHFREVNFLQHAIGGGVAVGFVTLYLISTLKERFSLLNDFLTQIFFLYFLVCAFGVANELLEFLLDFLKIGIFSADRYDTWFDLVANTTGAFTVFLSYKLLNIIFFRK